MNLTKLAAVAAVAALAQTAQAAPAAAATQSDDRAMTKLAATILGDATAADKAIAAGNTTGGENAIGKALAARASLATEARAAGVPMIVPIYAELDDTAVLTDAVKAKAVADAKAGKQAKTPTTVRANDADLTYLAIDLDKAKAHLDAAKSALATHNTQGAKDSLAAVGSDLVEGSVVTDLPLVTAREDLSRAQRELTSNDRPAALTDLHQASKSLLAYTNGDHTADARRLAAQIDASASRDTTKPTNVTSDIEHWWSSVTGWVSRKL